MPESLSSLPLFPLGTVLFPHAPLFLHVFEPRYRELVTRCRERDGTFGVVLLREGDEGDSDQEPYMVGTHARIREVRDYPDGRMDVHAQGGERFRIRLLDRDAAPYLVGRAEPLREESWSDDARADALLSLARERFETLVRTVLAGKALDVRIGFPDDPAALSFAIANLIELPVLEKQRLLETTDTVERLAEIVPALEVQIARAVLVRGSFEEEEEATRPNLRPLTLDDVRLEGREN